MHPARAARRDLRGELTLARKRRARALTDAGPRFGRQAAAAITAGSRGFELRSGCGADLHAVFCTRGLSASSSPRLPREGDRPHEVVATMVYSESWGRSPRS